ncbi:chitin synthase chs-2-like isoform X3 [Mercenaria mercenaria]|uniref:chitin synthase chs-2-like isoform X3 n=1 Tax=Mercenaria mercenaria TaxID=6596 RepID=UPI00234F578A|nr:chitin synthase chs-2-like isoform X3 [Mercenaria mercenaria]
MASNGITKDHQCHQNGGYQEENKTESKDAYKWDTFEDRNDNSESSKGGRRWEAIHKVSKVIFLVILFLCVLGTAILNKSTVFLLVSNISPPNAARNTSLKTSGYHFRYETSETGVNYIWALVLIVISPYIFVAISSTWSLICKRNEVFKENKQDKQEDKQAERDKQKKAKPSDLKPFVVTFLVETVHSVGLSLLVFALLPNLDPVAGGPLFCLNIVVIPSFLGLIGTAGNDCRSSWKIIRLSKYIVCGASSITSMAFWTYYIYKMDSDLKGDKQGLITISVFAPLLISVVSWKNFIPRNDFVTNLLKQMHKVRTKLNAIVSLGKILVTLCMVSLLYGSGCNNGLKCIKALYGFTLSNENITEASNSTALLNNASTGTACAVLESALLGPTTLVVNSISGSCSGNMPFYIAAVNILSGFLCFRCCVAANKILVQLQSFSLPLVLSTPVTVVFMLTLFSKSDIQISDTCILPFAKWSGGIAYDSSLIAASILGYIAMVLLTNHIWIQSQDRMENGHRIFIAPLYCGVLLDQSLILNRRRTENCTELEEEENKDKQNAGKGQTTKIYVCATMWHETVNEMTQLLKSLFRLDEEVHELWCEEKMYPDSDRFKFEAHILFDDAFETKDGTSRENSYVKDLIKTIGVVYEYQYGSNRKMKKYPVSKCKTPYGGRIKWKFPCDNNRLIIHLKDKEKIRQRKRWSQVMYMYYLLSYKMIRNKESAENTFILALDGDVDFKPTALSLLIDRMKRNRNVAAACGRILPVGTGPMVWYQKFEYAVSHWLQKATEHTIGCVLCSPGCFSLFRASHLTENKVLKRYTTAPTDARHYIQYDQGEDRWLCTLLLQRGFRVEYCAASDAYTFAPEGFYEFYNQRRRWTPSTMANILDLLLDYKNVTKNNDDISVIYVAYQMLLMISSILTPGTIFLMITGALNMAYPSLSLYWALVLNVLPVAVFVVFCFVAKPNVQLAYAAILSTIYSLVMMLVIVGLLKQAADNGFCSVTTVFLCFVVGVFVLAAFIHPQEFWCILHGFLYFLAIPSMSMLLMLYSLCNLHVVSWGTRESPKPVTGQESAELSSASEPKGMAQFFTEHFGLARESEYMFSFGNLFRCICCPDDRQDRNDAKFHAILNRLDGLEKSSVREDENQPKTDQQTQEHGNNSNTGADQTISSKSFHNEDDMSWKKMKLSDEETLFWEELILQYLSPLSEDKEKQRKIQSDLKELRNKVCLFFLLVNALFVTIVFSLQQVNVESEGTLSTELPCSNGTDGGSFEPISMAFTAIFGILLMIQFVCMIFHRMSTFLQICSITSLKRREMRQDRRKQVKTVKRDYENVSTKDELPNAESIFDSEKSDDMEPVTESTVEPRRKYRRNRQLFRHSLSALYADISANNSKTTSLETIFAERHSTEA